MVEPRHAVIDRKTLVPVSIVAALLAAVIVAAFSFHHWIDSKFTGLTIQIDRKFEQQTKQWRELEIRLSRLEQANHHPWDSLDMQDWALRMREQNPSTSVPSVDK